MHHCNTPACFYRSSDLQVEARHEPDFDRWVEHDMVYIDGWSIWLDLKILARTLPALLAHGGR